MAWAGGQDRWRGELNEDYNPSPRTVTTNRANSIGLRNQHLPLPLYYTVSPTLQAYMRTTDLILLRDD